MELSQSRIFVELVRCFDIDLEVPVMSIARDTADRPPPSGPGGLLVQQVELVRGESPKRQHLDTAARKASSHHPISVLKPRTAHAGVYGRRLAINRFWKGTMPDGIRCPLVTIWMALRNFLTARPWPRNREHDWEPAMGR